MAGVIKRAAISNEMIKAKINGGVTSVAANETVTRAAAA